MRPGSKLAIIVSLLAALVVAPAAQGAEAPGLTAASALGVARIHGEELLVDVVVAVRPGENGKAKAEEALERRGAQPMRKAELGSQGFVLTGLVWDTLPVVQNYNPLSEPSVFDTATALQATHDDWDGVATSLFDFSYGGETTRCPSLVAECAGAQTYDDFNDVGWLSLEPNVLGVTWFSTSRDEADMALNVDFPWTATCTDLVGSIDLESVILHENGHVAGLGHSDDAGSVMSTPYNGAQCSLGSDDEEGVTYLYPESTGTLQGTVFGSNAQPIKGATVSILGTPFSAATDAAGNYSITGVPYPVTYDLRASAKKYASASVRSRVDEDPETFDFILDRNGGGGKGGGGGGAGPNCDKNPNHPKC